MHVQKIFWSGAIAAALAVGMAHEAEGQDQHYKQTNLVSNMASLAPTVDPNLVNPWGLTRSSGSPWWVSDNGTGLSTLYSGAGVKQGLVVTVPVGDGSNGTGNPTGTIFNGNPALFELVPNSTTKGAVFLFCTEDGTVSGWNPTVQATQAVIMVNTKGKSVFKGMTAATFDAGNGSVTYLYVADFRKGKVAVYDSAFQPAHLGEDAFDDENVPEGFAPFNVQNIGGNIYVSYAKQDGEKHDEVDGTGLGRVLIFSPRGKLLGRLQHGPWFNAPWGMTLASSDFGVFSHDVLVGQFGSGEILAFDPVTGKFKGTLNGVSGSPIVIDGLWAIAFGNGGNAGPATTLFFTAGPDHEANGLFGSLTAVENVQGSDQ